MLLEREHERAALAAAVERVAAGDGGQLVLVLGEAGIGKTALLAVAGELAQAAGIQASGLPGRHFRRRDLAIGWCASCWKGS